MIAAMSSPTEEVVAFFETRTLRAVFHHMFATLDEPRFEVIEGMIEGDQCFLVWNFHFRRRGRRAVGSIHGASHLRSTTEGRVTLHRDYWDAAQQVYEVVPVLGAVMGWLRRRPSAG